MIIGNTNQIALVAVETQRFCPNAVDIERVIGINLILNANDDAVKGPGERAATMDVDDIRQRVGRGPGRHNGIVITPSIIGDRKRNVWMALLIFFIKRFLGGPEGDFPMMANAQRDLLASGGATSVGRSRR